MFESSSTSILKLGSVEEIRGYRWISKNRENLFHNHLRAVQSSEEAGIIRQKELHLQEAEAILYDDMAIKIDIALNRLNIRPHNLPWKLQRVPWLLNLRNIGYPQLESSIQIGHSLWRIESIEKYGGFIPESALSALNIVKKIGFPFHEYYVGSYLVISYSYSNANDPVLIGRIGRNLVVIAQWI